MVLIYQYIDSFQGTITYVFGKICMQLILRKQEWKQKWESLIINYALLVSLLEHNYN